MADRMQALQELAKRGKLPAEFQPLYDEAVKRGLIEAIEPEDDGIRFKGAGSFLTGIAEGVPIAGPAILGGLQKAGAYGRTLRSGRPYEEELAAVQNMTDVAQEEHPYLNTAGNVAGAVAGLAPVAATGAGALALGVRGGALWTRAGAGALSGSAIGAGDSAVRSGGDPAEIAKGAAFGAAGGAAGPYVGQAIGAGARRVMDTFARPGAPLSSVPRRAAVYASETVPTPGRYNALRTELDRLGPDATLADVSPEWMGVARGAAARPGSRDEIVNHFLQRGRGANQRLRGDLDASLGPVKNPVRVEEGLAEGRMRIGQEYEPMLRNARAADTTALANDLDVLLVNLRGPARTAVERVRTFLNIPGTQTLDPNPVALLQTRHAIDGLLDGETNRQVIGQLTIARRRVDAELARTVPNIKEIDARYAELARQSEGLQRGSQVLDSGKTAIRPEDMAREMAQSGLPQGQMSGQSGVPSQIRTGARAEIDRVAGTSANDPAALQRLVKGEGDWNRDKLRAIFGPKLADDALNAIDRETTFYQTKNRVTSGSDTAMGEGFKNFLDQVEKPRSIPSGLSALGFLFRGGQEGLRTLRGNSAAQNAERFSKDLGRLSIATGVQRDVLLQAIRDYAQQRAGGRAVEDVAARLAQMLTLYSGQPLRVMLNAGERDRQAGSVAR